MQACRPPTPISSVFAGRSIGEMAPSCSEIKPRSRRYVRMIPLQIRLLLDGVAILCLWQAILAADELNLDKPRPACGKVCKLVCETKKLTAICYGSESKDIC